MKILALHPWGTSGHIFEKQLGALTSLLGPSHEFVFINGPVDSDPAQELPDYVPGPYYCWYEGLSSPQVHEAQQLIAETIEDEGPFDGVIGFSQGAALAVSMLLHHEMDHPDEPPPFKFGVFICTSVVVSPDKNFNADMVAKYSHYYKDKDLSRNSHHAPPPTGPLSGEDDHSGAVYERDDGKKKPKVKTAPKHRAMLLLPGQKEALVNELVGVIQVLMENLPGRTRGSGYAWPSRESRKLEDFPRIMHPLTVKARVSIPTVHVIGRQDPIVRLGELAARLCEKKRVKVLCTNGSHRLPVNVPDLRAIASAMEWAMEQSKVM